MGPSPKFCVGYAQLLAKMMKQWWTICKTVSD